MQAIPHLPTRAWRDLSALGTPLIKSAPTRRRLAGTRWPGLHKAGALCSMGDRRESEISFGHGSVGGARTLPCLAVQRPNACELVLRVGDRPFDRWVQGERSLTRVIGRRYGRMAREGSIPDPRHRPGDATGARSGPPCQDGFVLQNTSCGSVTRRSICL